MNGIDAVVAFEKLGYFEELFLTKKDCIRKLNYEVAEEVKKFIASCF